MSTYAIFTAMEGALLDFDSLECAAARSLLRRLRTAHVPVVPVTVMTLEEVVPIVEDLGIGNAMIIEAGGAIARRIGGLWFVEQLEAQPENQIEALNEIETQSGASLIAYSALSERESASFSGRRDAMLSASLRRRHSEPFLIEEGDVRKVSAAAASLGFTVERGHRFYYLVRRGALAEACSRLRHELRCETIIGVGTSPIDAGFLLLADLPIIIRRPDGRADPDLLAKVSNAIIAPAPGTAGWGAAVREVWSALLTADRVIARMTPNTGVRQSGVA